MEDNQPFIGIYDEYSESIFRYIHYKTYHRETAEDLTSQTFLKALEKWEQYDRRKGPVSPWLYGIARNLVTDHFRSKGKWGFMGDISDVWDLPSKDNVHKELADRETKDEIHGALGKLSGLQREIIILRLWEELPYNKIAPIVGKSEANCKMMFSRALKKLKTSLGSSILYQLLLAGPGFIRRDR